ncbi:response regulator [Candidatus Desantisbacteria bacterium]|nr:response regulator [Candidatus Desantisbacteria bacterium]
MALNILVVDDSAITRKMVIKVLHLSGVSIGEIHEAGNGLEGLNILKKTWIDLALVDLNMPVMNGEEMLKELRKEEFLKNLPVVIVSTEGSELRIEMLRKLDAKFVHKPFTPEFLKEIIISMTGAKNEDGIREYNSQNSGKDF